MAFETSAHRLWRTLSRADRLAAAEAFWSRPSETAGVAAAQEIVKLLRVRPQALARVPLGQRVRALAGLASPPELLADALLLALHVERRRDLLRGFLDALGIPHEEGLIAEETSIDPPTAERARAALAALRPVHGDEAIRIYWNALWLQDPSRWAALEAAAPPPAPAA